MADFQAQIIDPLENGRGATMPTPFAAGGQTSRIPELGDGTYFLVYLFRVSSKIGSCTTVLRTFRGLFPLSGSKSGSDTIVLPTCRGFPPPIT